MRGGTTFTLSPTTRGFYDDSLGKDLPPVVEGRKRVVEPPLTSISRGQVGRPCDYSTLSRRPGGYDEIAQSRGGGHPRLSCGDRQF